MGLIASRIAALISARLPSFFTYRRPGAIFTYRRPDGSSIYRRP